MAIGAHECLEKRISAKSRSARFRFETVLPTAALIVDHNSPAQVKTDNADSIFIK